MPARLGELLLLLIPQERLKGEGEVKKSFLISLQVLTQNAENWLNHSTQLSVPEAFRKGKSRSVKGKRNCQAFGKVLNS